MKKLTCLILMAAGCDLVFLPERAAIDAPPDADCNTLTPDEDADCVIDDGDTCPGTANADQADRDDDGVGDACDSNINAPGDRLIAFHGFNDVAASMTAWRDAETGTNGNWRFQPGHVEHLLITDNFQLLQSVSPIDDSQLTVEFGVEHIAFGGPTTFPDVGVVLDSELNDSDGHYCHLVPNTPPTPQVRLYLQESPTTVRKETSASNLTFANGDRFVLRMERRRNPAAPTLDDLRCRATRGMDNGIDLATIPRGTQVWPDTRYVAFTGRYTDLRIHWIALYGVDPLP